MYLPHSSVSVLIRRRKEKKYFECLICIRSLHTGILHTLSHGSMGLNEGDICKSPLTDKEPECHVKELVQAAKWHSWDSNPALPGHKAPILSILPEHLTCPEVNFVIILIAPKLSPWRDPKSLLSVTLCLQ